MVTPHDFASASDSICTIFYIVNVVLAPAKSRVQGSSVPVAIKLPSSIYSMINFVVSIYLCGLCVSFGRVWS